MKKKISLKLATIKNMTLKLNTAKQLPFKLVKAIMDLTPEDSIEKVKFLMALTEHYLRVKNYYKNYADAHKQANADIEGLLKEKGYLTKD